MREKTLGIIYIIVGIYLGIFNPIMSMIFNQVYSIGFYVPIGPLTYWGQWFFLYGWYTVLLAVLGVYLIIIGYRYLKKSPND